MGLALHAELSQRIPRSEVDTSAGIITKTLSMIQPGCMLEARHGYAFLSGFRYEYIVLLVLDGRVRCVDRTEGERLIAVTLTY